MPAEKPSSGRRVTLLLLAGAALFAALAAWVAMHIAAVERGDGTTDAPDAPSPTAPR